MRLDSVQVGPHETWDSRFRSGHPGIWMLHCQVLVHASTGMTLTVNYAAVWTPYTMCAASGSVPE